MEYYPSMLSDTHTVRSFFHVFSTVTLALTFLLSGCQSVTENKYTQSLNRTHIQSYYLTSANLPVAAWSSVKKSESRTIRIYIEGDGRSWVKRNRRSSDPTPTVRLVHALIAVDPKVDTAYIARPCQYVSNEKCTPDIWTFSRYNQQAVNAVNEVVQKIKHAGDYKAIELVGFSGGATIALLLAARRSDIVSVRTIAGNLDPEYTNTLHNVSPMPTALNPVTEVEKLENIPQWHFVGANDPVIKPSVFAHYLSAFTNTECIKNTLIESASHSGGWIHIWPKLLTYMPSCS